MSRFQPAFLCAIAILATACTEEPKAEPPVAATAPADGLIAGTPAGDLPDWAREARESLKQIEDAAASDRAAAHKQVLDLYVGRQEYMEMYYGPNGRMQPDVVLAEAIKTAESRFHDLMRVTGAPTPAPVDSVKSRIAALDAQLAVVEENSGRSARRVRGVTAN